MRVLVTGGAGFIGSHVVDTLAAEGHDVSVIDALIPAAHAGPPDHLNPQARYTWADVRDGDDLDACLRGVDAICHQAAMVGLGVDFGDAGHYVEHNDVGTVRLLAALHHAGFSGRLVIASSMVVYGEGRYRCAKHGDVRPAPRRVKDLDRRQWDPPCPDCGAPLTSEPITEDAPLDPRNVYAATKLHQEHLAACFAREHPEVQVVALRYHNVYGSRMPQSTPYAGVASIFRSALAEGRPPLVFEDGGQLRDFVHVDDVARANVLVLVQSEVPSGFTALNVASGDPRTVADMARTLCGALDGMHLLPRILPRYRLGDVRHVMGSTHRAEEVLGFRAQVPFAAGMADFARCDLRAAHLS